jgi:hypothetical protein
VGRTRTPKPGIVASHTAYSLGFIFRLSTTRFVIRWPATSTPMILDRLQPGKHPGSTEKEVRGTSRQSIREELPIPKELFHAREIRGNSRY